MAVKLIDPDLNLDNKALESYTLDLLGWDSETATQTLGDLGGQIHQFQPIPVQLTELEGQPGNLSIGDYHSTGVKWSASLPRRGYYLGVYGLESCERSICRP